MTATTNLVLTQPTVGGSSNTWGDELNTEVIETIDRKLGDVTSVSTTGGNTNLTSTQELVNAIEVSGTLVSNATLTFSGRGGLWAIKNGTSGAFTVTVLVSGQTGVAVGQGKTKLVYCNGTDIVTAESAGLSDIVDDTTPQAGGNVDMNTFVILFDDGTGLKDDSGNEQLLFGKTASAINYLKATNAAASGDPVLEALGDDTDVGLLLRAKGAEFIRLANALVPNSSDGAALGTTALMFADLFLASGAIVNFNAGNITITHAAGKLTFGGSGSVELALADALVSRAKLKDTAEVINDIGDFGGGAQAIDYELGQYVKATVSTSTVTFTFTNPPASGIAGGFTLKLTNGGSQTVNWPASVDWAGGSPPSLTAAGVDILGFITDDGGTTWYCFVGGLDFS